MKVGLEKLENHEGVAVKALLDSRATGLFMNTTFAKEKGFKMEKLKKPLLVRNVDGTVNAGGGHNTPGRVQYILQRTYGEGKNGCMQFGQNGVDTGNAVANSLQSRNRLGKRGSENDTLPTYIWKKKAKRKGEESKKNRKGQEQESIKKTGTQKILEVEKSIQEKGVGEDASTKGLGPRHRIERRVYAKEEEGIFTVERRKGRGTSICGGSIKERIHLTLQVTPNITSTLCGKKGWHTEDGTRLSICKPVDNKEWIPLTPHHRYIGWSGKEKGVYEAGSKMEIQ